MHIAVIDCGTNTFHLLLVAPQPDGRFKTIHKQQIFVYLAEEGIGTIGEIPFGRGIQALRQFREIIDGHGPAKVKAIGTAALRTASNGQAFVEAARTEAGIGIQLVSGEEEARLICIGVRKAVPFDEKPVLIMDIGGGSVEFIVTNHDTLFWAESFPIGVAVLFRNFHHTDPIAPDEVARATEFLENTLRPMAEAADRFRPVALVGASGTFDVLEDMIAPRQKGKTWNELPIPDVQRAYDHLLATTLAERLAMPEVPEVRAKLIVVAMILIEVSLRLSGCPKLLYSTYAMKQGILFDSLSVE